MNNKIILDIIDNNIITFNLRNYDNNNFNIILKALQLNNSITNIKIQKHIYRLNNDVLNKFIINNNKIKSIKLCENTIFEDTNFRNYTKDIYEKYYITLLKILKNKNNFNILKIKEIYSANTVLKILKNKYNFDLNLEIKFCNISKFFKIIKLLKNKTNNIHLKINLYEHYYYVSYTNIFNKYKYYYDNNYSICQEDHTYNTLTSYTKEELYDIKENTKEYYKKFDDIIFKEMNKIIDDFKIIIDNIQNKNNIKLTIYFKYMFRNNNNYELFKKIFYKKYEVKNIIFQKNSDNIYSDFVESIEDIY